MGDTQHPVSVGDELRTAASDSADQPYLLHEGGALTFSETYAAVRSAACGLIERGLKPGDRIAVWASNDLATAIALLAIPSIGAIVVPLNTRYTTREVSGILRRTRCSMILAPDHLVGRSLAREALGIADGLVVVCLGPDVPEGAVDWADVCATGSADVSDDLDHRLDSMTGEEVVVIQFTSGTTGQPKGALLRQGSILSTGRAWGRIAGLTKGDVYPIMYPLSHVGGFKTGLLSTLMARAAAVLIPVVTTESIIGTFQRHEVTVFNGPPTVLQSLLEAVATGVLATTTHIRTVVTGSTIVPPQLVRELSDMLGVQDVINAYGLTEASGVCSMTRRGDAINLVCETLGRAIDGVDVRIAPGAPTGEIEVRGPHVMVGYLDDPEATAAVMHDGWLRTGDTGSIDTDGYIRITGRATDMIIVGGFNVYPAEVEHLLLEHDTIGRAAVVGAADQRLGEVPVAFVVPSGNGVADPDRLIAWCREQLANFKVPRRIWVVDELPLGDLGKVAKPALRERAAHLM